MILMQMTVSGYYVKAVVQGALYRGYPVHQWLAEAGISPDILQHTEKRVPSQHFTKMAQLIWHYMQDEYMGFFEQSAKPGTFHLMCLTMIHGQNLRTFFERSIKFYDLITDNFKFHLDVSGDRARFSIAAIRSDLEPNFLIEALLAVWHRFASWLCGQQIVLHQASLTFAKPAHVKEYPALFFCPVTFDQPENVIEFSSHCLNLPLVQSERSLRMFLRNSPVALVFRLSMADSLSAKVRFLLSQNSSDFNISSSDLALSLQMSPPTLRRRLKDEGTSFQEIRDHLRRDLALACLEKRLSIDQVCATTGFSDPSAFYRAFKRWTGFTPSHYLRKNNHA
jgi:AraC-like DNA-binding protein